jgi:hypothetical protein
MGSDFSEPKLVQMGDINVLKRKLIINQLVTLNFVQGNDIPINLITSINFLGIVCPKICVVF